MARSRGKVISNLLERETSRRDDQRERLWNHRALLSKVGGEKRPSGIRDQTLRRVCENYSGSDVDFFYLASYVNTLVNNLAMAGDLAYKQVLARLQGGFETDFRCRADKKFTGGISDDRQGGCLVHLCFVKKDQRNTSNFNVIIWRKWGLGRERGLPKCSDELIGENAK